LESGDSWVSAEPMVADKTAEPGRPREVLYIHGAWGDRAPRLLQGIGQIATKMWPQIRVARMHQVTADQLDMFAKAYGQEFITLRPDFSDTIQPYESDFITNSLGADNQHSVFEVQALIDPDRTGEWDWIFGTTLFNDQIS
jgi:hypothetical protein